MEHTDLTKSNNPLMKPRQVTRLLLASVALLPCLSVAAEINGGIQVGASRTDNVLLAVSPGEVDDIVYQASPFFSLVHQTPKLDVNANYTFNWYRYSDLGTSSRYHRGQVTLAGKALQDSLTAELGARRSQVLANPDSVIPPGRLPLSGNLLDQDEWWFNPHFSQSLGGVAALDADYRYSKLQYSDGLRQDNANHTGSLGIQNYAAGQGLTWAMRYNWRRTEYEFSTPWEFQQASAELGFWLNAETRVFASGGKESAWNNPFDPALEDPFWEAGFAHTAGENFSAELAAGERTFGTSWRGNLNYTFRRGNTTLSYSESPTTTGFNRTGGIRNILNPDDFDDFLDRPGAAERYIVNRLQWTLNLNFRRTGFVLSAFDEDRSDRSTADGAPLPQQSQTGVSANFTWQAGQRTQLVASGSMVDRDSSNADKSRFNSAGLSVNYRLGAKSNLSLGYSYNEQQPRGQSVAGRDYVANIVSLFFTYTM